MMPMATGRRRHRRQKEVPWVVEVEAGDPHLPMDIHHTADQHMVGMEAMGAMMPMATGDMVDIPAMTMVIMAVMVVAAEREESINVSNYAMSYLDIGGASNIPHWKHNHYFCTFIFNKN